VVGVSRPRRIYRARSWRVWRAIISSSLVGTTQAEGFAAGRADARTAPGIGRRIDLDAEPRRLPAHGGSRTRARVFADAAGEDERVEPAERGGQRDPISRPMR
jgi:hypothetical protein